MAEDKAARVKTAGRVKDARGRYVTQIDPVAMLLLHRPGIIDPELLRAITSEKGVAISKWERFALIMSIIVMITCLGMIVGFILTGHSGRDLARRFAAMAYSLILPFIIWGGLKRSRFSKIAGAMLKHLCCPHCGYNLRGLPRAAEDDSTVCPECGCAWMLAESVDVNSSEIAGTNLKCTAGLPHPKDSSG